MSRMEIAALSRGKPQMLNINGQRLHSSIIHEPIQELHLTSAEGVQGNELAAHNAPVYSFFTQHYDYWADKLGVVRSSWEYGHWGENITFSSDSLLDEHDFHLGDTWSVGKTVVLQVCGARIPCNKLSWRCGQKDSWLKALADSGLAGVYFKVLRGGTVYVGDIADRIEMHPKAVNAAEVTQAAFGSPLTTRDTMNLLVDDPNLLYMNKGFFERKLSMARDADLLDKNAWKGWRRLRVSKITDDVSDIKSFYLTAVEGDEEPLATYLPGQFLTLKLPVTGLIRSWSISDWQTCDKNPDFYRISIKKAAEASKWMHEHCEVGCIILVRSPAGPFHLDWSPMFPGRQVYLSAGIGVTPVLSMLKAHHKHSAMRKVPAIWIQVATDSNSVPMWDEIRKLTGIICPLEHHIFLTREPDDGVFAAGCKISQMTEASATFYRGRPSLDDFRKILQDPYSIDPLKIKPIEIEGLKSTCYICGSTGFEKTMKDYLKEIGVPDGLIRSESFSKGASPDALQKDIEESCVTFRRSGKVMKWTRSDPISILEVAERGGLELDYGCRVGSCGACRVKLVEGSVTGANQESDGSVTICCSKPATTQIVIDA